MSRPDFAAELRASCWAVKRQHLHRLRELGVSYATLAELNRDHYGFGVAYASDVGGGMYQPGDGELHLTLPIYQDGELVDLVAFRSDRPDKWLLRSGLGWALGLERGLGLLRHSEPLPLATTPLDWLRGGCEGLCVLDWLAPELAELSDFAAVYCSDATIAGLLRKALTPPPRIPNISVGGISLVA